MSVFCIITTTFPDRQSAHAMSERLLEKKLVACIQVQEIQSFYRWEEKHCQSNELLISMKTRSSLFSQIEEQIRLYHPYTTPQLIQIPIENGLKTYLQWIENETAINE